MLPAIIAVAAVVAVAQAYNSEQARGANASQLRKLRSLYDSLTPPDYDLRIEDPPDLHESHLQLPKYSEYLASPTFQQTHLDPHTLSMVGQYSPTFAQYVQEQAPQLLNQSDDMAKGRASQMRALERYKQIGEDDFDPVYQAAVDKAGRSAQQEAHSASQSILQEAQRRGNADSGLTMALQQAGSAQAMNRLAESNQSSASDMYRNRLQALAQGASLGGDIQSQDMQMQGRNADIINSFNQRMQRNTQDFQNSRADLQNKAQLYNLGEQQRIADENNRTQNSYDQNERSRLDDITRFNYGARQQQQARGDSIADRNYQNQLGQTNQANDIAQRMADWKQNQRAYRDNLMAKGYQDQVQKVGGQAVPINMQIGMNNQNAADRNNAMQGIANVAGNYYQYDTQQEWQGNKYAHDADMAQYQRTGKFMTGAEKQKYKDGN